jgi:hypothetical protein
MVHLKISRFNSRSIGWLIVSLLTLLSLVFGAYLLVPPIRARCLVRQLEPLQVGHSTFKDAQRLAEKLGAKPDNHSPCDQSYCFWIAVVSNAQIPQWWRGSGVTFIITFEVKDSVVVHKGVGYDVGIDPQAFISSRVTVAVKESWSRPMQGYVLPSSQKGWRFSYFEKDGHRENVSTTFEVRLTPGSSTEDWKRYTAFNYSCF